MLFSRTLRNTACFLGLTVLVSEAHANRDFCLTHHASIADGYAYCADSDGTGTLNVALPDMIGQVPALAQSGAAGAGFGSSAYAFARPGRMGGAATAFVSAPYTGFPPTGAFSIADASLFDSGTIDAGMSGLALGAEVMARITMRVQGAFSGTGEATTHLLIQDGATQVADRGNIADRLAPTSIVTFDVGGLHIGDFLLFQYDFTVRADADNEPGASLMSTADASHTALLNIDFLAPGVLFDSASGFDYALDATGPTPPPTPPTGSVPEPATWMLGLAGLTGLGLSRRKVRGG